jgi:hypothetical protein
LTALVPPGVVTVTSTVPEPAGEVAMIWVWLTMSTFVAPLTPKLTAVAPFRFVPEIVTAVPPEVGPDDGLMPVMAGGGGALLPWYPLEVAWVVSDVVRRESVEEVEALEGLVTPTSLMLTPCPAGIDLPVLSEQVRVVVLLKLQNPTAAPAVVSVTVDLTIVLSPVLAGKLIVIWLFAVFDSAPVPEVVNPIV